MVKKNLKSLFLLKILILFSVMTFLSGCAGTRQLVIDGEKAREIENWINNLAHDPSFDLRGTAVSNIRNGGGALIDSDNLYLIRKVSFSPEDTFSYLQKIPMKLLGTPSMKDDYIAETDAVLLYSDESYIYFIDKEDGNRAKAFDKDSNIAYTISERPVSSFQFFDSTGYFSDAETGDILRITGDDGNFGTEILSRGAGDLIAVEKERLYTYPSSDDHSKVVIYDRTTFEKVGELSGNNFDDAQVSGAYLYYIEDDMLRRKLIDEQCPCDTASILPTGEYALYDEYMVIGGIDGGLFMSSLDGTHIVKLSDDKASNLHLFDDFIFYRNGYDENRWYLFQLSSQIRQAVTGETMTDGGPQFSLIDEYHSESVEQYFSFFILEARQFTSTRISTNAHIGENVLFVDVREPQWKYYTHKDSHFSNEQTDAIVIITSEDTLLGKYTDGDSAYRTDTRLTLFIPGDVNPVVTLTQEGQLPIDIKTGDGDRYGSAVSWHLKGLELMEMVL